MPNKLKFRTLRYSLLPVLLCLALRGTAVNYIPYYKAVSKARLHIYNKNFDSAVALFRQTFATYTKVFPRDAHLAMKAASMVHDFNAVASFFIQAVPYGLDISILDTFGRNVTYKGVFFGPFLQSERYQDVLEQYPELRKKYMQNIDTAYREHIRKLDDWLNNAYDPMKRLFGVANRTQADTAVTLMKELQNLIAVHGFPSVFRIGTRYGDRDDYGTRIFKAYLHTVEDCDEQLWKAVVAGEVHLYDYAKIRDSRTKYKYNIINGYMTSYDDARYFYQVTLKPEDVVPEVLKRINTNRGKDGLLSYEDHYNLRYGMFLIRKNPDGTEEKIDMGFALDYPFW